MTLKRIQRKRTKGWKMPENCVYVGRPSRYGNPYRIGEREYDPLFNRYLLITIENCLPLFKNYAEMQIACDSKWLDPLRKSD